MWKRFGVHSAARKTSRRGNVFPTNYARGAKTPKTAQRQIVFLREGRRGNVSGCHSPKTSPFQSPKLVRDKGPDGKTFSKRFHVETVDPESWRRGNVSKNVSTSSLSWKGVSMYSRFSNLYSSHKYDRANVSTSGHTERPKSVVLSGRTPDTSPR